MYGAASGIRFGRSTPAGSGCLARNPTSRPVATKVPSLMSFTTVSLRVMAVAATGLDHRLVGRNQRGTRQAANDDEIDQPDCAGRHADLDRPEPRRAPVRRHDDDVEVEPAA